MEPNFILIGMDDMGKQALPPSWVPNKFQSDQVASIVPSLQHGQSFSSEGESLDSLSEKALITSPKSEHSFMDSGNDDDSTLADSINASTLTKKIENPPAVQKHYMTCFRDVSLRIENEETCVETNHPLCCDASPSWTSDAQLQSPSFRNLLDLATLTPNSSGVRDNQSTTIIHHHPFSASPQKESDMDMNAYNDEQQPASPTGTENTSYAVHCRAISGETPQSWSSLSFYLCSTSSFDSSSGVQHQECQDQSMGDEEPLPEGLNAL